MKRAAQRHRIKPFDFDVTLFRARDSAICDPLNGWGALARGRLDVVRIEGEHATVILDGRLAGLAAAVSVEIAKVRAHEDKRRDAVSSGI